jgi:hypothetical protein
MLTDRVTRNNAILMHRIYKQEEHRTVLLRISWLYLFAAMKQCCPHLNADLEYRQLNKTMDLTREP